MFSPSGGKDLAELVTDTIFRGRKDQRMGEETGFRSRENPASGFAGIPSTPATEAVRVKSRLLSRGTVYEVQQLHSPSLPNPSGSLQHGKWQSGRLSLPEIKESFSSERFGS